MFQNIKDLRNNEDVYDVDDKKVNAKVVLKNLFAKENIVLYVVTFLISMVGISGNNLLFSLSPFGLAIIAASLSNNRPIGIMYVLSLIATFISFGFTDLLIYFMTSLLFFALILFKRSRL